MLVIISKGIKPPLPIVFSLFSTDILIPNNDLNRVLEVMNLFRKFLKLLIPLQQQFLILIDDSLQILNKSDFLLKVLTLPYYLSFTLTNGFFQLMYFLW